MFSTKIDYPKSSPTKTYLNKKNQLFLFQTFVLFFSIDAFIYKWILSSKPKIKTPALLLKYVTRNPSQNTHKSQTDIHQKSNYTTQNKKRIAQIKIDIFLDQNSDYVYDLQIKKLQSQNKKDILDQESGFVLSQQQTNKHP